MPTLREALRAARAMLSPPPDISVVEWSDTYRVVAAKTSAAPGQWKTNTQPVAYGAMLAVTESDTHTVTIMAGTQICKSEILLNVAGYFVMVDPSPVLFVQPTQGAAQSFAKERFSPMVAATPELAKLVALPRARDSEATISHRSYPGGSLDFVGGNSPVDLSSRPKRIVLSDEIDKFPPSAGSEGDPLKLAEERASHRNVGRSLCVRTCSPTDKETSRIWREYGFSDQRKCFVGCPHCCHEQVLTWAAVSWDEQIPETARILCSGCGAYWSETDRKEAIRALEHAPGHGSGTKLGPSPAAGPRRLRNPGLPKAGRSAPAAGNPRPMPVTPDFTSANCIVCAIGCPMWSPNSWSRRTISN